MSMQPCIKAAILSGLVFPGLGQFLLRKKYAGFVFVFAATAGLFGYLYDLVTRGLELAERALPELTGNPAGVLATAQKMAEELTTKGASPLGKAGLVLLVLAWIGSVVHALMSAGGSVSR